MYSAYKLNKQGDNIQPCRTPFLIWNQSVVPRLVLAVTSWPAYRFLRRQVRWSGIPISFKNFPQLWSTQSKTSALLTSWLIKQKWMFFWNRPLLGLLTVPWNCQGTSGCVISLVTIEDQGLVLASLGPFWFLMGLCCILGLCHSFKRCTLPLCLLLHWDSIYLLHW